MVKQIQQEQSINLFGSKSRKNLIDQINSRKRQLKKAEKELKKHFCGIDLQITQIINSLETWFCLPNLQSRPTIICLFGATGVGKTDLVRRLVKLLNYTDKYCEIELSSKSSGWNKSIGAMIRQNSNVVPGEPSILLLDEVQAFRTIDAEGKDILDYELQDIWTLLSDGKLPYKVEVESLMNLLWDYNKEKLVKKLPPAQQESERSQITAKNFKSEDDLFLSSYGLSQEATGSEDRKFDFYNLNYFKKLLRLDNPLEEIALWSDEKKKQIISSRLMDKSIFEEDDYSKTLIFISGNLDEAYGFTKNASEADIDADILHEKSKKITILDIKEALGKRFRPEQISRMGNMHVIYPTLSKEAFKIIIGRRVSSIIQRVYQQTGIRVLVNQSVNDVIYRNGVFPTQGTRPLFSTISEALESVLPKLIFTALKLNKNEIILSFKDNKLVGRIGNVVKTSKYYGSLDKIKHSRNLNVNRKTLAAVHEAAHAIIHAILFKVSPNQIVSTPVSAEMEGFVYSQENCHSKDMLHKRLRVTLAGQQAEIMVFGENNKTSGGEEDLKKATSIAAAMVRKWGMDANFSSFYGNIYSEKANSVNNDIEKTNSSIENLIRNASEETFSLLSKNSALLIEVVDQLMVADKLEPEEFKKICSKYGLTISISKASEEVLYWNFYEKLNEFKNKNLKNKNANIP